MAYDEQLARRIREALDGLENVVEKKMFGGVTFLVQGNMACGVNKENLIVRLGSDKVKQALLDDYVIPFALTGSPMANWVLVKPAGCRSDEDLKNWVGLGVDYASSLPPK